MPFHAKEISVETQPSAERSLRKTHDFTFLAHVKACKEFLIFGMHTENSTHLRRLIDLWHRSCSDYDTKNDPTHPCYLYAERNKPAEGEGFFSREGVLHLGDQPTKNQVVADRKVRNSPLSTGNLLLYRKCHGWAKRSSIPPSHEEKQKNPLAYRLPSSTPRDSSRKRSDLSGRHSPGVLAEPKDSPASQRKGDHEKLWRFRLRFGLPQPSVFSCEERRIGRDEKIAQRHK